MDSGFEGGFLLADSPKEFHKIQPYYNYFKLLWKLTDDEMTYICNTDYWGEAYGRAREKSKVIKNKKTKIFDKTPIYMKYLSEVLMKVPGILCVVIVRDPRSVMSSWAKWTGHEQDIEGCVNKNLQEYTDRYLSYANGFNKAFQTLSDRILLIQYEHLCLNSEIVLRNIFNFLGLEFKKKYMKFSSKYNVYGKSVSKDYLCPYKKVLTPKTSEQILKDTNKISQWHFEF